MAKIDPDKVQVVRGSRYPAPFDEPCRARSVHRLSDVAGLTQFGVVRLHLPPGAWSSQRHWHALEDEFAYVLQGEVVLVTDAGEETLRAGDCAGFKAGTRDGHHVQNRSATEAVLLVAGSRMTGEHAEYPDIDMMVDDDPKTGSFQFRRKDGTPY